MNLTSDGIQGPNKIHNLAIKLRRWFDRNFTHIVTVQNKQQKYLFECKSQRDFFRATTLFSKEAGTVNWLLEHIKEGDVFYDIGANVGIYSIMAGYQTGDSGHVYSFEPHVVNFSTLLNNITLNKLNSRVTPLSIALNDKFVIDDFNYNQMSSGSSTSQLGGTSYDGVSFNPICSELKIGVSIDHLIKEKKLKPANHIKLDVDGNELLILKGMSELLNSETPPKTVQVEMNINLRQETYDFMSEHGYEVKQKHFTSAGLKKLEQGIEEKDIQFNAIFTKGGK